MRSTIVGEPARRGRGRRSRTRSRAWPLRARSLGERRGQSRRAPASLAASARALPPRDVPRFGLALAADAIGLGGRKLGLFRGQPLDCRARSRAIIASSRAMSAPSSARRRSSSRMAGGGAARLLVDLGARDRQALQRGGGRGLVLAQCRQPGGDDRPGSWRPPWPAPRRFGDDATVAADSGALRLGLGGLGGRPAQVQQHRLGLRISADSALVAVGLAGLALEALDLRFHLGEHVLEPVEIGLGGAQAQFGLVAAGVQAGDAGRLLEQRAARLGLGLDQFADAALADHRGRARAGRGVGEEQLHVLGADFLAVDAVDRAGLALDAARHLHFVGVVEGGRRGAVGIVEEQRHLGGVARRAVAGAGKDHVVHAGGAHVLVGAFAHHPAQRLDKIGLAAAVRPDDAGQAGLDDEFGRFDEGLEAEQAQLGELHARPPPRRRRASRTSKPRSPACGEMTARLQRACR